VTNEELLAITALNSWKLVIGRFDQTLAEWTDEQLQNRIWMRSTLRTGTDCLPIRFRLPILGKHGLRSIASSLPPSKDSHLKIGCKSTPLSPPMILPKTPRATVLLL
jgi:hypothetical protein